MRTAALIHLPRAFWISSLLLLAWLAIPSAVFFITVRSMNLSMILFVAAGAVAVFGLSHSRLLRSLEQRAIAKWKVYCLWSVVIVLGLVKLVTSLTFGFDSSPDFLFLSIHSVGIVLLCLLVSWQVIRAIAR